MGQMKQLMNIITWCECCKNKDKEICMACNPFKDKGKRKVLTDEKPDQYEGKNDC